MLQTYSPQPASMTAADYIIVVSTEDDYDANFHQFADKVNRKLRAGYQLHGHPININRALCQAMVRVEGPSSSGDTTSFYKSASGSHPL